MSEVKHTPGQWVCEQQFPGGIWTRIGGPVALVGGDATCESVEFVVGTLKDWGQHGAEQTAANARLIAAAPDLLAACKALVEWRNDDKSGFAAFSDAGDKAHAAAVAAIAKAEGASPCDA